MDFLLSRSEIPDRSKGAREKETNKVPSPLRKRLYTLRQAAEYLGRSDWSMRELIWAGKIQVVRQEGARKIFVDIEDLNNFIDRNKSTYL